ncbi:hypothetical protein COLO4_02544 [Corchorus olitorius]|uniref:Uncharacterized protein n=1 Tax=Corchorus olitorius TaxID=93759 RepID=A0A1R3L0W3_9ROSI|nr:hypothetical protein COLO4_02544 [Corchorus olitorius]
MGRHIARRAKARHVPGDGWRDADKAEVAQIGHERGFGEAQHIAVARAIGQHAAGRRCAGHAFNGHALQCMHALAVHFGRAHQQADGRVQFHGPRVRCQCADVQHKAAKLRIPGPGHHGQTGSGQCIASPGGRGVGGLGGQGRAAAAGQQIAQRQLQAGQVGHGGRGGHGAIVPVAYLWRARGRLAKAQGELRWHRYAMGAQASLWRRFPGAFPNAGNRVCA